MNGQLDFAQRHSTCSCCLAAAAGWLTMYSSEMVDHEESNCVCTQMTKPGIIARAGAYWNGLTDTRMIREEWQDECFRVWRAMAQAGW